MRSRSTRSDYPARCGEPSKISCMGRGLPDSSIHRIDLHGPNSPRWHAQRK